MDGGAAGELAGGQAGGGWENGRAGARESGREPYSTGRGASGERTSPCNILLYRIAYQLYTHIGGLSLLKLRGTGGLGPPGGSRTPDFAPDFAPDLAPSTFRPAHFQACLEPPGP